MIVSMARIYVRTADMHPTPDGIDAMASRMKSLEK